MLEPFDQWLDGELLSFNWKQLVGLVFFFLARNTYICVWLPDHKYTHTHTHTKPFHQKQTLQKHIVINCMRMRAIHSVNVCVFFYEQQKRENILSKQNKVNERANRIWKNHWMQQAVVAASHKYHRTRLALAKRYSFSLFFIGMLPSFPQLILLFSSFFFYFNGHHI